MHELIGLRVMHRTTKRRGRIKNISDRKMIVSFPALSTVNCSNTFSVIEK